MTERRSFLFFAGGLFVVLAIFYFRFLSGARSFYMEDITQFFEPFCRFVGGEMAKGRLPLWNPYEYCGMSQVALSSPGVFYPTTLAFAFLPFSQALALNMIVHQWLSGLGAFLLVASLGWGVAASVACGLIMSMSGYMFSASTNYTLCAAAAWCPFTLWSFLKLASSPNSRWLWTAVAALFVALLLAAGRPEISFPQLVILAAISLYARFGKNTGFAPEAGLWQMRAIMIGALIAMPSFLPALEWAGLSRRASGMLPVEVFLYSASWYDFLCLIAMNPLGDLQLHLSAMRALIMPQSLTPYIGSSYLGPVTLALAALGLFDDKLRFRFVLLFGVFASVLLAAGSNTPVAPLLLTLFPPLSLLRFPVKLLFFLVFGLALLAARGVFRVQKGVKFLNESFFFFALLSLAGVVVFFVAQSGVALIAPVDRLPLQAVLGGERACAVGLVSASLLAALLSLLLSAGKNRSYCLYGCLVLLGASLLLCAWQFSNQEAPPDFFKGSSAVADRLIALSRLPRAPSETGRKTTARVLGLYLENFTMPPALASADRNAGTVDVYDYARQLLRPNTNIDFQIASPAGFEGCMVGDYYYTLLNLYGRSSQSRTGDDTGNDSAHDSAHDSASETDRDAHRARATSDDEGLYRFCQMTATEFVVTQCRRPDAKSNREEASMAVIPLLSRDYFTLVEENERLNFRFYRLPETLPRVYFSNRWRFVKSHRQAEHDVFDVASTRFDPTSLTLIEHDQESASDRLPLQSAASAGGGGAIDGGNVEILEDLPASLSCKVRADKPGLVVVSDQFYPGWIATLDGHEAPILRANAFMKAVAVPRGEHQISLQFRPRSLSVAFTLTFMGLLWLSVLGVSERLSKHRGSLRRESRQAD